MDDPARRDAMGRRGQARVNAELGWQVTSANLVRAYEFLLSRVDPRQRPTGSGT
jgi:hypothetical protein